MFGRKSAHSILSRLERLEAMKPGSLESEVTLENGTVKRVDFAGLKAMREEPSWKNYPGYNGEVYDTGFPEFRIVGGDNLKEFDELFDLMFGDIRNGVDTR